MDSLNIQIEQLVRTYGKEIFYYCYRMLNNKQDAEDAVQEVFIKAYNNISKINIDVVSFWLYKVACNHCKNLLKKRRIIQFVLLDDKVPVSQLNPEDQIEENEFSIHIQSVLNKLTYLQKSILILRAIKEFEYSEISIIMKRKPEAIRKQYERAKRKITDYLNRKDKGESG